MQPLSESAELTELVGRRYPRAVEPEIGLRLTLTPMVASDWQLLERFLRDTPDAERRYFRREATDPARVERWCSELDYQHIFPLLAWQDDQIVADAVLQREPSLWTSHVGKLRLLVHSTFRGRGVGRCMVHELVDLACQLDLHKVIYECAAEQQSLIAFLQRVGFSNVARLPDFIRDRDGMLHDMVVMSKSLD